MTIGSILKTLVVGVALAAAVTPCRSQPVSQEVRDNTVREARDLAGRGMYADATTKLEALYAKLTTDPVVVRALFDVLTAAEKYDRAEEVIKRYLKYRPDDVRGMADLATLYLKTGRKADGEGLLDRIIAVAPKEAWPYQISFQTMIDVGMNDEALAVASRARAALDDSILFAVDASRIYAEAGRYGPATREYLRAGMDRNMGDEVVADYVLKLAARDDARQAVIDALRRAAIVPAYEHAVNVILWQVYLMDGACQKALEVLSAAANTDRTVAGPLLDFAGQARRNGCYEECSRAYEIAVGRMDSDPQVPGLLLAKAECELAAGAREDALATYDRVVSRYKDTIWSVQANLAGAEIDRDLGRLDEALGRFDRVIAATGAGDDRYAAILLKGDCLVRVGKIDEAFQTYDMVGTDWSPDYAQEAFFNLGEIDLYRLDFDGAASYYNVTLRQYPAEPRANDSIDRLLLLKSAKRGDAYGPALKDFARAALLRRQGDLDQAMDIFRRLAEGPEVTPVKVESLRNISEIYLTMGLPDRAVATYKVLGESLDTYLSPSALETVGDLYLSVGRSDEAARTYEDVIIRFPKSVSAGDARRKLESIRQEGKDDL